MMIIGEEPGLVTHRLDKNGGVKVETQRADGFPDEHEMPDIVKIDVESAEIDVLEEAEEVLSNTRTPYCEAHDYLDRLIGAE